MPEERTQGNQNNQADISGVPPTPQKAPVPNVEVPFEIKKESGPHDMNEDVAKILEEIKLPERREFKAGADRPQGSVPQTPDALRDSVGLTLPTQNKTQTPPATPTPPPTSPEPRTFEISPALTGIPHEIPQNTFATSEDTPVAKESDARPLRTLKDDLAQITQNKKLSLVQAVALEEEKRGKQPAVSQSARPQRATRRILTITIVSLFLIALGGLAFASIAFIQSQQATPTPETASDIMFSEQTFAFPLPQTSARTIKQQLALARTQVALTLGAIARIVPTVVTINPDGTESEERATFEVFLTAIGARPPEGLTRALASEFFLGVHAVDQNVPVLVIPVVSYERAFSGMLAWESSLNEDLDPFFTYVPAQVQYLDGNIAPRTFEDVIVQNYDVRVVKDGSGAIRLLYAFPTRDILIIAESPFSFTETLSRLRAERRL